MFVLAREPNADMGIVMLSRNNREFEDDRDEFCGLLHFSGWRWASSVSVPEARAGEETNNRDGGCEGRERDTRGT